MYNVGGTSSPQMPFGITPPNAPGNPAVAGFAQQQQAGGSNPFNTGAAGGPRKTLLATKRRTHV